MPSLPAARTIISFAPLAWGSWGNILAAAGVAFLDMVAEGER